MESFKKNSIDEVISKFQNGVASRNHCISLYNNLHDVLSKINPDIILTNPLLLKTKHLSNTFPSVTSNDLPAYQDDEKIFLQSVNTYQDYQEVTDSLLEWINACNQTAEDLTKLYNFAALQLYKQTKSKNARNNPKLFDSENSELRQLNFQVLVLEALLGKREVSALPSNLQIEPSDRCNAKCKPCPHCTTRGWAYNDLDTTVLSKLDGILSGAQFVEIFALGEPSIAPSFEEITDLVSGYGCETHIITNGATLGSSEALSKIKKIGVSIDGDNPTTFESIRSGLKFDQILKAVKVFREKNQSIFMYFTATINRANLDEIPGIAKLAKECGMNAVCFHRMSTAVPALAAAVLKKEDIEVYRSHIKTVEGILEGSSTLLFDYALLDKLRPEDAPLNKQEALTVFYNFTPTQANPKLSVQDAIQGLENKLLMPLPSFIKQPHIRFRTTTKSTSALNIITENSDKYSFSASDTVESLKIRLNELRNEIASKSPKDLTLPYCLSPWFRFILKADGRMFPCSCWSKTYENINKVSSFEEAWNNSFMKDLRKAFTGDGEISNRCKNCVSIDRYQGLTELLYTLNLEGITYDDVSKLDNFDPPPGKLKF